MISCRIEITGRTDLPEIAAIAKNRKGLLKVLGAEGVRQFKQNFRKMGARPNALRAPSTGFWMRAAASTSYAVPNNNEAVISVSQPGVRLQYLGGTVTAAPGKAVPIPVHPDAHGKNPSEMPGLFPVRSFKVGGLARLGPATSKAAEWMFIFKKSVTIREHPEVLPTAKVLGDAIDLRTDRWLARNEQQAK